MIQTNFRSDTEQVNVRDIVQQHQSAFGMEKE